MRGQNLGREAGPAGLTLPQTAVCEPSACEHRSAGRGGDPTDQCCGRHRSGLLDGEVFDRRTLQDAPVDVEPGAVAWTVPGAFGRVEHDGTAEMRASRRED